MSEMNALPERIEPAPPAPDHRAGTAALAEMPQSEFQARLAAMQRGRDRLREIHQHLMTPETDYGVIPGTAKPTLLKAGAEKLLHFYRLACEFTPDIRRGDGESEPWLTVVSECRLHVGDLEGPVVATGHGAANSWEKRYRRGGTEAVAAYDMLNTLIKMAHKRAMVDAALRATATSGVYSQDMEDLAPPPEAPTRTQEPKPARSAGKPALPPHAAPEPPPMVVCAEGGCGVILSPDEIKAAGLYAEAFGGEKFCREHGKPMLAIWKAKQPPAEPPDPFVEE